MSRTNDEPLPDGNPFADTSDRFATDQLIRRYGFRILRRRRSEEPVWTRDGEEYRQRDVLRMISGEEVTDARRRETDRYARACR